MSKRAKKQVEDDDPLIAQKVWMPERGVNVHVSTVSKWRRSGMLPPAIKIGRQSYDRRSTIEALVKRLGGE